MEQIVRFGKEMLYRINEADVSGLSAQLAYFFLLSLFPFLLFLVTLLGFLPIEDLTVMDVLETYLPNDVNQMIQANLTTLVNNRSGSLLSISIIGTLWSASNGFNALKKSFNKAFGVEKERSFVIARVIAIGLMILMVAVIAIALLLQVFGELIGKQLFEFFGLSESFIQLWNTLRWAVSSVTFFIVFLVLYKLGPNKKIRWRDTLWGALFATLGWQIASLGFSFYVNTLGNYSAAYGSLGTVIVLMIWFYLSGIIITTGGVINAYAHDRNKNIF